jgi:hypothetical protein
VQAIPPLRAWAEEIYERSATWATGQEQPSRIQQPGSTRITPSYTPLSSPADLAPSTSTGDS